MIARFRYYLLSVICHILPLCAVFAQTPANHSTPANNYKIEHLTDRNGLSYNCISYMMQDNRGFIWIGTDNGLNRYDGYQFRKYVNDPADPFSISNNHCRFIYEDPADSGKVLWIATQGGGLNKFDLDTEKFYSFQHNPDDSSSLSHNEIVHIFKDSSGRYWLSTRNGGLNVFDRSTRSFSAYLNRPEDSNSVSSNRIFKTYEDRQGTIWIGTSRGLNKLLPNDYEDKNQSSRNEQKFNNFQFPPEELSPRPTQSVYVVYEDYQGVFWVGSNSGLFIFDRKKNSFMRPDFTLNELPFLRKNAIQEILEDKNGELWIACVNGIVKLNAERTDYMHFYHYQHRPESLSDNYVSSIFEDHAGILWAGTRCGGINKLIPATNSFRHFTANRPSTNSLSGNWIYALHEDKEGVLWVGNHTRGIDRFNKNSGQFHHYKFENSGDIFSMSDSRDGKIWLARNSYLTKMDKSSGRAVHYPVKNEIYSGGLRFVLEDRSGIVWCITGGLYGGQQTSQLFQFKESSAEFIPCELEGASTLFKDLRIVFQDSKGIIWFATESNGLFEQFDIPENTLKDPKCLFRHYQFEADNPTSLSSNKINTIYEDASGKFWIGTALGLNKYNAADGTFLNYREKDGLASDMVLGILGDNYGHLWISTGKGISRFNPGNGEFRNYDASDGLPRQEYGYTRYAAGRDGELYFAGSNGIIAITTDSLYHNLHEPDIVFTDLKIFNKSIIPGSNSPLQSAIFNTHQFTLNYDQDVFSLEFAALDYRNPAGNIYAYKMLGVDPDWVHTDAARRFVTYTRLSPGEYDFQVKAANNDGVWNDKGASLKITITPPWWQTEWAILCYMILGFALLGLTVTIVSRRQKEIHELKMRRFEAGKHAEIDQMKSRFFANVSHEFRTPLTLIQGPVEQLITQEKNDEKLKQYKLILRNSNRLLLLINQLLDLSRLDAGKMRLQTTPINIVPLLKRLTNAFLSLAERRGIHFHFIASEATIIVYVDVEKLEKIVNNLLSNALKFSNKGDTVITECGLVDGSMETPHELFFRVSDSGSGINADHLPFIFNRFYQADHLFHKDQKGSGIGLALSRELVELHRGNISVVSSPGKGSTFTVVLPLGKNHLSEDEIVAQDNQRGKNTLHNFIDDTFWSKGKATYKQLQREENVSQIDFDTGDCQKNVKQKPLVLVVEDNEDLRQYIQSQLEDEFKIIEAIDGAEGVEIAHREIPDLIISDVMMPKMDGYHLCQVLKSDEKTCHIPLILLTARADMSSKLVGLETGADDYLSKPFDVRELTIRIKNLLEKQKRLQNIYGKLQFIKDKDLKVTSRHDHFLQRVRDAVELQISNENFSVKDFAGMLGMSRSQLHRKLIALTGKSPGDLIRQIRLYKAARLIRKQFGRVTEVAYEVGFSNPAYFARCFREEFGITPSAYNKKFQNNS